MIDLAARGRQSAMTQEEKNLHAGELWTARQRAAHRLHEISYRACFKPQLPRYFIELLTRPGDRVYDPFMGRGTTLLEAALCGRIPAGCDVNPLSRFLTGPRLAPPEAEAVAERLTQIALDPVPVGEWEELLAFYHPATLGQLLALRSYFLNREWDGRLDGVDEWIRMVAVSRLTGHSPGFFSVYTLPPNQAVSVEHQRLINAKRQQTPPPRDVPALILKKSRALLAGLDKETRGRLHTLSRQATMLTGLCDNTPEMADESVSLVVTSPPFLDVVDYAADNWLRCWFCGIDSREVQIPIHRRLADWAAAMTRVFRELFRLLTPGGHVAFEVGEIRGGTVLLDETVLSGGLAAGLTPLEVLINQQAFTKTSNCWGVRNGALGTNSNRIVLFRKDE